MSVKSFKNHLENINNPSQVLFYATVVVKKCIFLTFNSHVKAQFSFFKNKPCINNNESECSEEQYENTSWGRNNEDNHLLPLLNLSHFKFLEHIFF